ncbi:MULTISPECIES: uroporphyrinogen-III C-methyltransferase [unclassified Neisseria]|uniref:uroporphyrinogen-III C-methyltransferase n=1 Tax=unclassified Neisseria TaxID=2623750 RepID=UPI001072025B|nr:MULTISPECIES: uroporphyrinogen-III C-methyltransferase [unclassified Neisseria]MBF0804648.1 uroporphyrinogen-III C-methyltransferase [Neisseria sp. 19428wB4_WF04]TFU40350.1 heme biosynthesis operon protein HemX [Neisseria sp. WF04]
MSESKNPQPLVTPVVIKQSSGRAVAVVALALSVLALGAGGFLFVQGQNILKTQEIDFNQKIDKAALGESHNASMLQDALRKQNESQAVLEQIIGNQKHNADKIAAAERAYRELLKGRADWLVDETETMLSLASQQLLLTGNVPAAVAVLENIESRLSRFDHPELLPVKQAVAGDLTALKNRPYLDVSAASLRLNRLEAAIAGLPLIIDGTLKPGQAAPQAAAVSAANLSWWENAWQKSLSALKDMVEVRRLNNNDAMLMAPDQAYFVRENLRLRLLDARTALLQHNGEVYLNDLNSAEASVKQYFDISSPATQSWLRELADLTALDLRAVADDALKTSLNAVRNYQETVRPSRPAELSEAVSAPTAAPASSPAVPAQASEHAPVAPASPSSLSPKPEEAAKPVKPATVPEGGNPAAGQTQLKGERA